LDKITGLENDIVSIKDILTIIQGPAPIVGCIIIATTNDFDGLYQKCPPLFRAGRMTPVNFGYMDAFMLDKISNYYFGRKFDNEMMNRQILLQPSKVIEVAMESLSQPKDQYGHFMAKINDLIKQQ
jgi:hypothetical protein